jgi:hypothetical protein
MKNMYSGINFPAMVVIVKGSAEIES